ncbi:MAG: PEP-CTERM sorting domain-containing protein [Bryobacteraceae bacterium]|nr:PEP-CTERM sorting domain-containing protein [Bryobacteraceae bacterium]
MLLGRLRVPVLAIALAAQTAPSGFASLFEPDRVLAGAFDSAVRILGNNGSGSGIVFGSSYNAAYNSLLLCIATADHVFENNWIEEIGFRSDAGIMGATNPGFEADPSWVAIARGGSTGKKDLGFIAASFDLGLLGMAQQDVLKAIASVPLGSAFAFFTDVYVSGYGDSGVPATADEQKLFGVAAGTYVHHVPMPASENYGIQREWNTSFSKFGPFDDGTYEYDAAFVFLDTAKKQGMGLSGDSGSGMIADGKVRAIFTFAESKYGKLGVDAKGDPIGEACDPNAEMCPFEFIFEGAEGGGVALDAADIAWYESRSKVPEPTTYLLALAGLAFLIARRRAISSTTSTRTE